MAIIHNSSEGARPYVTLSSHDELTLHLKVYREGTVSQSGLLSFYTGQNEELRERAIVLPLSPIDHHFDMGR